MLDKNIFSYSDYKKYLGVVLSQTGESRGLRTQLAKKIGVHSAFISHVLKKKVHFSLEHALKVSHFLGHTEGETKYFLLMVELGRAGSPDLQQFFRAQMEEIHSKRSVVAERLQVKQTLSVEDQLTYYSAWYFGAIHILLSIPGLQTKQSLGRCLHLEIEKISECLEFLCRCGLAVEKGDHFQIGSTRLHIPANSPLISKHHTNWRVRAIQALENFQPKENLHFSGAITLAKSDAIKVRQALLDAIEKVENIYKPSKEEVAYVFNLDFFQLVKGD